MNRILVVLLGLGVLLGCAYYYIKAQAGPSIQATEGKSAPKQTLDNVRVKAKSIEDDGQRRADEAAKSPGTE